jgi:protein-S-isoprenylcysteine O-methyltransferase
VTARGTHLGWWLGIGPAGKPVEITGVNRDRWVAGDVVITLAEHVLVALFPVSEIALALVKRSRVERAQCDDRGSWRVLWLTIGLSVALAIFAMSVPFGRLAGSNRTHGILAVSLLVAGLTVRWVAILTLGRFFTVDVAIQANHAVVRSGVYAWVRHPSYSGPLLAFLGLGVSFENWISILVLLVPICLAVLNRVRKEERALAAALGSEYIEYCASTKRFIPGLI